MPLEHPARPRASSRDISPPPLFSLENDEIPRNSIPAGEMSPDLAYQLIHDELMLDGNARLNLATFVTTCLDENRIDMGGDLLPRRSGAVAVSGPRHLRCLPYAA